MSLLWLPATAHGQGSPADTQTLRMIVPQAVAIISPGDVSMTHDLQEAPQSFPPQIWRVRGNISRGVSVHFHVNSAFVHEADATLKRDAILNLTTGQTIGPADWIVTTPHDQTNFAIGDDDATVSARSDDAGGAHMLLGITFVTGTIELLREGEYQLLVTGTIAANQ